MIKEKAMTWAPFASTFSEKTVACPTEWADISRSGEIIGTVDLSVHCLPGAHLVNMPQEAAGVIRV